MWTKKPEILAPAGSYDIMQQAFQAGADAVYLGGTSFGARAYAANLTEEELLRGIEYTKLHHKKLYLTVNTLLKNEEIDRLFVYLKKPYEAGLDAVIVQDMGVAALIHEMFPEMELHASTQMSLTTHYGANLLKEMGAVRIVPARELSIEEIRRIKQETGLEIEVFVHGALCYSYSGHCLLSSMIGGRSGNRGRCAQPCRQQYSLPDGTSGYYLSPKDLCGLSAVPELIEAGVDSFKIEGRMKKPEYVISAVEAYKRAVEAYVSQQTFDVDLERERLADIFNRGNFTEGYFHCHNGKEMMCVDRNNHNGLMIGTVVGVQGGQVKIHLQRNLNRGDVLEIRTQRGKLIELTSGEIGRAGKEVWLNAKQLKDIQPDDLVFRTKNTLLCETILAENSVCGLKENIHISVTLKKELSAMIKADCGEKSVTVTGTVVTKAQNQPLTEAMIIEKLNKLGEAPFVITDITIDMDEDCFFSMKEFNALRRQALAELEQVCSVDKKRQLKTQPTDSFTEWKQKEKFEKQTNIGEDELPLETRLSVAVSTLEQLELVCQYPNVQRMELELEAFSSQNIEEFINKIHQFGKKAYINLPRMFRRNMEPELLELLNMNPDGFIVRTLDELAFLREKQVQVPVICDYSLYAYNWEAVNQYQTFMSNLHLTLPVELNGSELEELLLRTPETEWEWILYGCQPVMITTQCTIKNTTGCYHEGRDVCLKNDHKDVFRIHPVCKYCYNVIYQKEPTSLIPVRQELKENQIKTYRILLTTERKSEINEILNLSSRTSENSGHYKKGIE